MAHDEGVTGGAVFMAFVCGALAGAAVALLWAPASGEEARRFLGDTARESSEKSREFIARQREHLATAVEKGREAYRQAREGQARGSEKEEPV